MTNQTADQKKIKLSGAEARSFARELWVCFNSFNMYGPEHPAARKGVEKLYQQLKNTLVNISRLTLHTEAGSLHCEQWQVDRDVDVSRLVKRMNDADIHSITFFDFIRQEDLQEFIKIILNARKFKELEDIKQYIEEKKIRGFIFDFYQFKKIPSGGYQMMEPAVSHMGAGPGAGPGSGGGSPAAKLVQEFLHTQTGTFHSFSQMLHSIRTRFESGDGPPPEKLREAIARLKALLDGDFVYGLGAEPAPEEWGAILAEIDSLTVAIMSRAVLEALQSGEQPISGMSDFFRTLDPGLEFTMKVLPQIKKDLFDNHITLLQYLQFIQSLADELTLERFKSLLLETGGNIGVVHREIADEMRNKTEQIIPLVNLAMKLEPLMNDAGEPVMYFLYQYAEKELRSLVMKSLTHKTIETREDIETDIDISKQQYLRELAEGGMALKIVRDLNNIIKQRISVLGGLIWAEWLIHATGSPDRLPGGKELRLLAEKINSLPEGNALLNSVLYVLEEKGLSRELLNRFIKMATGAKAMEIRDTGAGVQGEADEPEAAGKSPRLPQGIPNIKETQRYLEMEINRALRYHTPLSCLSISVAGVVDGQQLRPPTPPELAAAFLEILQLLEASLRNLDYIGSLGTLTDNHIFVVMTMTGQEGGQTVADRIGARLKEFPLRTGETGTSATAKMSLITFDPEETPDLGSFIHKVKSHHQEN
jgi:hypothetical protein